MTPATDWKEVIPEGEAAELEQFAERLRDLQKERASTAGGGVGRALHAKGHAGVEAELTVLADLPEYARVGLFSAPKTHRCYVRFSNGSGKREADKKPDIRGLAIKVLDVPGKKIIPGLEDATTQDFLLIHTRATPFRNAGEFVWFVFAADSPALLVPRALFRFGPVRGLRVLGALVASTSARIMSFATTPYFSALPTRFGPYAARFTLEPKAASDQEAKLDGSPDAFRHELAGRLAKGPVEYELRAQFFVDEAKTPIEDGSRDWAEADSPFVPLATLTLAKQDIDSPRGGRLATFIESLSFDPWHAPEEFRPLGNMMRARNHAYRLSTKERGAAREPDGSERFD